ncbi:MAG: sterol desaturase family protein [Myxococcales bacterium]|jgi:hypothetical protein|nr:sterol desaturase family protein [Myxococcales bacterium]
MSLAFFSLGALAWSASEYAIHRFVGHGPRRKKPSTWRGMLSLEGLAYAFNSEHLAHHADPSYFAPSSQKAAAAALTVGAGFVCLTPIFGPRRALAFATGLASTYLGYEIVHRRIHTHAPKSAYAAFVRKHHLLHHHKTPKENHGVTTPVWDAVFGTYSKVDVLRMPRGAAPAWMTGADGEILPAYADDYTLVGPKVTTRAQPTVGAA